VGLGVDLEVLGLVAEVGGGPAVAVGPADAEGGVERAVGVETGEGEVDVSLVVYPGHAGQEDLAVGLHGHGASVGVGAAGEVGGDPAVAAAESRVRRAGCGEAGQEEVPVPGPGHQDLPVAQHDHGVGHLAAAQVGHELAVAAERRVQVAGGHQDAALQ
jgi:hypothetical protein